MRLNIMNTPRLGQQNFLDELGPQIDKLEQRCMKQRATQSLWVWCEMLRSVWKDAVQERREARERQAQAYRQMMLLDVDLHSANFQDTAHRIRVYEQVGRIKELLACFALMAI